MRLAIVQPIAHVLHNHARKHYKESLGLGEIPANWKMGTVVKIRTSGSGQKQTITSL